MSHCSAQDSALYHCSCCQCSAREFTTASGSRMHHSAAQACSAAHRGASSSQSSGLVAAGSAMLQGRRRKTDQTVNTPSCGAARTACALCALGERLCRSSRLHCCMQRCCAHQLPCSNSCCRACRCPTPHAPRLVHPVLRLGVLRVRDGLRGVDRRLKVLKQAAGLLLLAVDQHSVGVVGGAQDGCTTAQAGGPAGGVTDVRSCNNACMQRGCSPAALAPVDTSLRQLPGHAAATAPMPWNAASPRLLRLRAPVPVYT